jgi:membrane-associated phospholipid phosphatase
VTELGNGATAVVLLGGIGAYGYFADDHRAFRLAEIGLESFAFTGALTQGAKLLAGRERPSASTRPGGFWHGPFAVFRDKNGWASFDSFPSGHTTTAFSMATCFSDIYGDKPWVAYVAYGLAGAVGVTRIMEQTHWASDVVVGAVIGTYGTKFVEYLNSPTASLTVIPRSDAYGHGILVSVRL